MKLSIDSLITRGLMHELRCEDDYLIYENDEMVIAAVFDGCSSGLDSHFSSTFFKRELKFLLESNDIFIVREDNNRNFPYRTPKEVLKVIVYYLQDNLNKVNYNVENELLSTCVIAYINKNTDEYGICFAGDGECYVDGEQHIIHDSEGNSVWYLSTVNERDIKKYINEYCTIYEGQFENELIISTDGISTFVDKYNCNKSEDVRSLFYGTGSLGDKYLDYKYCRIYNLLDKGIIKSISDSKIKNLDDFTIIKIKRNVSEE